MHSPMSRGPQHKQSLLLRRIERLVNEPRAELGYSRSKLPAKRRPHRSRRSITGSYRRRLAQIERGAERLGLMEAFLIAVVIIALSIGCFFLFVIEPRRKIYDR